MHEKYFQKFLYISNWNILQIKYKKENFKLQKMVKVTKNISNLS